MAKARTTLTEPTPAPGRAAARAAAHDWIEKGDQALSDYVATINAG